MFNGNDLVKLIKQAALEAVNASKPANMIFGTVISASPLQIQTEQKLPLTAAQLVLSRNVTDFTVSVSMDWTTEPAGSHSHSYGGSCSDGGSHSGTTNPAGTHVHQIMSSNTKTITIHNALKIGDKVILMQVSGGQRYIVIDRIGKG